MTNQPTPRRPLYDFAATPLPDGLYPPIHFALMLPESKDRRDVPGLLRHLADTLEALRFSMRFGTSSSIAVTSRRVMTRTTVQASRSISWWARLRPLRDNRRSPPLTNGRFVLHGHAPVGPPSPKRPGVLHAGLADG